MRTVLALLLLAVAVPARADIFEVPLPELLGLYDPGVQGGLSKTATFHLPGPPAVVRGATLHLVGTTEVGTIYCGANEYPWFTTSSGQMLDGPNQYWVAEADNPGAAGPFDTNGTFKPLSIQAPAPTWGFLSDGQADITLFVSTPPILLGGCYSSWPPPKATVTGAWIRVDADIPVPAAGTSWGALKAIYR